MALSSITYFGLLPRVYRPTFPDPMVLKNSPASAFSDSLDKLSSQGAQLSNKIVTGIKLSRE
jgi:hypothetical protein